MPDWSAPEVTATIVLAGGKGTRLHELTARESKPAVHFAGRGRIVDFVMANVVRSGLDRLLIATQFAPASLHDHLPAQWGRHFSSGRMILRDGCGLYGGTADAVRRNWAQIRAWGATQVLVLAADHIYDMDYGQMIAAHRQSGAAVTVAADVVPRAQGSGFGVMRVDAAGRIHEFLEKPADPPMMPGHPDRALVSMGVYVISTSWLQDRLFGDAAGAQDFGHDLIPMAVAQAEAASYRLPAAPGGQAYWRDVGTLQALREAHLDFLSASPARLPRPTKLAEWSLGRGSVAMPGAQVPASARLSCTIVAPGAQIPPGLVTGEDADEDARWFRRDGQTLLVTQPMLERRAADRARLHPVPRIVA